jgi:hypothetical protein
MAYVLIRVEGCATPIVYSGEVGTTPNHIGVQMIKAHDKSSDKNEMKKTNKSIKNSV